MHTGMTRGYRREVIQSHEFREKEKEFHLEVLLRLRLLGAEIGEIPATLEWKDHRLSTPGRQRKSSANLGKLVMSHLNFAVFANPIRSFWAFSIICMVAAMGMIAWAFVRLMTGQVSIFAALLGLFLGIFGAPLLLFRDHHESEHDDPAGAVEQEPSRPQLTPALRAP